MSFVLSLSKDHFPKKVGYQILLNKNPTYSNLNYLVMY